MNMNMEHWLKGNWV